MNYLIFSVSFILLWSTIRRPFLENSCFVYIFTSSCTGLKQNWIVCIKLRIVADVKFINILSIVPNFGNCNRVSIT